MFVFQDANWNVTATLNYDTVVVDRVHTKPYGEPTFDTYTINGDYDGDGDLDASDDTGCALQRREWRGIVELLCPTRGGLCPPHGSACSARVGF